MILAVGRIDLGRLGEIAEAEPRVHRQHELLEYQAGLLAENRRTQDLARRRGDHLGEALRPAVDAGPVDVGIVDPEDAMVELIGLGLGFRRIPTVATSGSRNVAQGRLA